MPDIESRLASLGSVLDEAAPQIDGAEVIDVSTMPSPVGGPDGRRVVKRRSPALAAALAALSVVLLIGGGFALSALLRGTSQVFIEEPSVPSTMVTPSTTPESAGSESSLQWLTAGGDPGLDTVRHILSNCCFVLTVGDGAWSAGWGDDYSKVIAAQPIPPVIGRIRSITGSGMLELVAVSGTGPSAKPHVAATQAFGAEWTSVALPTDVPSLHTDVLMEYTVWSVAQSEANFVVFGTAGPEIDPAAVEREYPDLAPVVRTDLVPPCCEGEPLTNEIEDPLWVWTTDPGSEPTAVSLSTFGLTHEDLHGTTGVVWVFHRPSGPAPWVATTTLIINDVGPGPESFLKAGQNRFVLLTRNNDGGYDTRTSPSGETWTQHESTPGDVTDLEVWGLRPLVLTAEGAILKLTPEGTWTPLADAGTFDLTDAELAEPEDLAAGDAGIVVVGGREEVLPWSEGEPIPTAQVLWFSPDGTNWTHQELSDVFGEIGAIEVAMTRYGGNREEPPSVIIALGVDQANGEPITDPAWWYAPVDR